MQTVVRALSVLRVLSETGGGLTLQGLSDRLGIPVGSMHRILGVLAAERFITRSPADRRYYLGPAARALSAAHSAARLRQVAQPELTAASGDLGQTVFLTELAGGRATCVAIADSSRPLRLFVRLGQEMPLHAAAAARILLAYRAPAEAQALLASRPLERYTDATPASAGEILAHLATVRDRGYELCDDELDHDVWAVAAPVFGADGTVAASVTMAAPITQLPENDDRDRARAVIIATARNISAQLGYQPDEVAGGVPSAEHTASSENLPSGLPGLPGLPVAHLEEVSVNDAECPRLLRARRGADRPAGGCAPGRTSP